MRSSELTARAEATFLRGGFPISVEPRIHHWHQGFLCWMAICMHMTSTAW